jgi:hypothetical protein
MVSSCEDASFRFDLSATTRTVRQIQRARCAHCVTRVTTNNNHTTFTSFQMIAGLEEHRFWFVETHATLIAVGVIRCRR